MEIRDARSLSPEELEDRRKQSVMLFKQGRTRVDIAAIVGVHRNTVGQWIAKWREGGAAQLKVGKSGRPFGSGRSLTAKQERYIQKLIIDHDPEQLKMSFALWNRQAVRDLIYQEYNIKMPIRTVGEYLSRWGFTPQKPVTRAYERSEPAVRHWLEEEYPMIAARARSEGAEIHWSDETGIRSDDGGGRGYSPRGVTPVKRIKGTPEKINMISSVTNQGKLRFMFYKGGLNAEVFKTFLKRLLRDGGDKTLFVIVDNLRVHHSRVVREWVAEQEGRIELHYLPSYSPDLNPDEFLNSDLKGEIGHRPQGRQKGVLKRTAFSIMRKLQQSPARIKRYFEAPDIQYAR